MLDTFSFAVMFITATAVLAAVVVALYKTGLLKQVIIGLCFVLILGAIGIASGHAEISAKVAEGTVVVKTTAPCRILITKGKDQHHYDVGKGETVLPLTFGTGKYSITEYFHISGNKYKPGKKISIKYNGDKNAAFKAANIVVNYNDDTLAVKKAAELCFGLDTEKEKTNAIYKWVRKNFTYDNIKAIKILSGEQKQYYPDVDETFRIKSGVCYDLSAMVVAMLRSQGIAARLEKGDNHAWVVASIEGKDVVIDMTSALQTGKSKNPNFQYKATEVF